MSTLDSVILEVVKRLEATGGKAWISIDSREELKLAFLEALLNSAEVGKSSKCRAENKNPGAYWPGK
jgi:hypothetical protein